MDISPAKIVNEYGLSAVHRASGIPIGTLARWRDNDEIPGREGTKRMREAQLATALNKLIAEGAPKKGKAKRARAA